MLINSGGGVPTDIWYEGSNISQATSVGSLFADGAVSFSVLFTFSTTNRGDVWEMSSSNNTYRYLYTEPANNGKWAIRCGDTNKYAYASYSGNSQQNRKTVVTFDKDTRVSTVYDGTADRPIDTMSTTAFDVFVSEKPQFKVCGWRGNSNTLVINHIVIYKRIVTEEEITEYLS